MRASKTAFLFAVLACHICFAQDLAVEVVNATTQTTTQTITTVRTFDERGLELSSTPIPGPVSEPIKAVEQIVKVTTEAERVIVKASDKNRIPIAVEDLGEGRYRLKERKKAWVTVRVINQSPFMFDEAELVIEPSQDPDDDDDLPIDPDTPDQLTNLKFLIVYESGDQSSLPESQKTVMYGAKVRNKVAEFGEFRLLDADTKLPETSGWRPLLDRERSTLPWLVVAGDEGIGFDGPLPINADATLRALQQLKPVEKKKPVEAPKPAAAVVRAPRYQVVRVPITVCDPYTGACTTVYETRYELIK